MRTLIFTLILIAYNFGYSQSTLQVNVKDCRKNSDSPFNPGFKVFKNDSLIDIGDFKFTINEKIIENLEYGKYRIEYQTFFNKTENVNIKLTESKKYNVDLCLNFLDYKSESYKPFIERLKNNENYTIELASQGCFHSSSDLIEIEKKSDKYYITFGNETRLLTESEIKYIKHFEIELNYMESSGCTTVDTYLIKYNNEEVKISDGSCEWNGDYYLRKELKLTKQ